jgi:septation ring formation regulator EzrA
MTSQFQQIDNCIRNDLNLIFKGVSNQYSVIIEFYASLFDLKRKNKLLIQSDKKLKEMKLSFIDLTPSISNGYLKGLFSSTFNAWKSRWGDISWTEVAKLKEEIAEKSEQRINSLIDARVNLMRQALEQAIAFYSELLEEQERYQQETTEQRLAEKAWIDHQRQELEKLQESIDNLEKLSVS